MTRLDRIEETVGHLLQEGYWEWDERAFDEDDLRLLIDAARTAPCTRFVSPETCIVFIPKIENYCARCKLLAEEPS